MQQMNKEVKVMDLNKVEIISKKSRVKVFVDGVELKGLQSVVVQKNASDPKTTLYLNLICNLDTIEKQPVNKVVPCVD